MEHAMASGFSLLRALAPSPPHSDGAQPLLHNLLTKCRMMVANCHYEFIKHYLTATLPRWAVDVPAKSVYVGRPQPGFRSNLLPRSPFGLRLKWTPKNLDCSRPSDDRAGVL